MAESALRELLGEAIMRRVQPERRVDQPRICDQLGLPDAPNDPELSKRQYVASRLEQMPAVPVAVAERFLEMFPVSSREPASYEIEEILWRADPSLVIDEKHRRLVARALDGVHLAYRGDAFMQALERLGFIDRDPLDFLGGPSSLRARVEQHVVRNPDDWPTEHLFEELGAYDCSHRRFGAFLEALASHRVRPVEEEQRRLQAAVNEVLSPTGVELRETGSDGGYPVFTLCSERAPEGRVKNLIFASTEKPDLRFADALTNEIEILSHADKVLVYDRPLGARGLTWQELQDWWAEERGLEGQEAKRTLYRRLQACLPESSPPQRLLFDAYHRVFGAAIPSLPVLLPEVWLHYDPIAIQYRGRDALLRQRMDFLLLLSSHARVVVEVDGQHHYESPERYAQMMRADRELRLAGYEVYHFGAHELLAGDVDAVVGKFFRDLFRRHGVVVSTDPSEAL